MIEVNAMVMGPTGANRYLVKPQRQNACGGCSSQSGCASGAFIRIFPVPDRPLTVDSDAPLKTGQQITIGIDERVIQRFAIITYLLPLAGLLLGGMLGDYLAERLNMINDESLAIVFGLAAMVSGFYLVKYQLKKLMLNSNSKIVLLKVNSHQVSIDTIGSLHT